MPCKADITAHPHPGLDGHNIYSCPTLWTRHTHSPMYPRKHVKEVGGYTFAKHTKKELKVCSHRGRQPSKKQKALGFSPFWRHLATSKLAANGISRHARLNMA